MTVLDCFRELVPIANPSGGEAALRDVVSARLRALGVNDQAVDSAGNLFARVPGVAGANALLLSAHLDSVPPCAGIEAVADVVDGRPVIRSAGKTILGADDKAGIATILALVEALSGQGFSANIPLELLFSTGEEVGLTGAKAFDMAWLTAGEACVLDGEGAVGEIFHAGPSQENLRMVCQGRPAHAGIAPEDGISAIEMAGALAATLPQGRLDAITTANLGVVSGGRAMNIVAPQAELRGEVRSHDEARLSAVLVAVSGACEAVEGRFPGSTVTLTATRRYDRFEVPADHPAVTRAADAAKAIGLQPQIRRMNIGSDAHVLNHRGVPAVVLGMGFHYSHSLGEYVFCDELTQVLQWMLARVAA